MTMISMSIGFVVNLELNIVNRSIVTDNKTIPVEITKSKLISRG